MTETPPQVVCLGIATLDAVALVDRLPEPAERLPALEARIAGGGVVATAAVTLARLGLRPAFIGRVGNDLAGEAIRDGLVSAGVDVTGLRTVSGRSPVSLVLVEAVTGERSLVPDVRGLPPIALEPADIATCAAADWVHLDQTGYPALADLRAAGIATPISLDGGNFVAQLDLGGIALYAPTERALLARYPGSSLDDALARALDEGPDLVVATRGAAGCRAIERVSGGHARRHDVPAFPVEVTSTLGAGDVFHGALLASLVERRPVAEALARANAAAALACRALDGRSGIPDRDELDAFLAAPSAGAVGAG
jgi:sulfofructose kinase